MCGVSGVELLVILVVVVIFLGPERLPEAMRGLGKLMREVRKMTNDLSTARDEVIKSLRDEVTKVSESAQLRESAGKKTEEVSEIDAIRKRRAAAEAEEAARKEAAGGDQAEEEAPSITEEQLRDMEKLPVQMRPAGRALASIANPYRVAGATSAAATAAGTADTDAAAAAAADAGAADADAAADTDAAADAPSAPADPDTSEAGASNPPANDDEGGRA